MISKMKKLTFLIYHKEYDSFLEGLRELGVVHVVEKQHGEMDSDMQLVVQRMALYKNVIQDMQMRAGNNLSDSVDRNIDGEQIISKYEQLNAAVQDVLQKQTVLAKECAQMEVWGDFEWESVRKLSEVGWNIKFFTCLDRQFDESWVQEYNAVKINSQGGKVYFITITKDENVELEIESVQLPSRSLKELNAEKSALDRRLDECKKQLADFCRSNCASLRYSLSLLQEGMELRKVKLSGEAMAEGHLLLMEGWVPAENEQAVKDFLSNKDVYFEIRDALKEDNAPIKLKNGVFARMYEVITKMYGMPEYGEFDPTPLLAPFFTLFFAFCVGDAGYGLILILLGAYLKSKVDKSMKGMMNLVMTLGAATTVLGTIFGTFFGVNLMEVNWPWLETMKQYMVASDKLMYLSLAIGVVHIIVAMTVKALCSTVRYGFMNSLSEWGWLLCVAGFVATGGLMYLERITPEVANMAFIIIGGISAIGIFLFNNIRRNIFINIGAGVWDTYNMATGLVGDVLSYIRLYALGLAGAMLGMVFNQLAFMIDIQIPGVPVVGDVLTWIFCGLILVFGHALNIAMSCLSGFVHPLRLTFVEYFKNSGYNGKGEAYKPFASIEENKK